MQLRLPVIASDEPNQAPVLAEPTTASDVSRWVGEARKGSQQAFTHLHRRFAALVHGILLGRFRPAVADELTQECFAIAFAQIGQLIDERKFGAWIAMIARRVRPKESTREIPHDGAPDIESGDSRPDDKAEAEALLRTISGLPEAYRETLMFRLVEGLSGSEIAELTGLTPASVRVNLHRGMQKLREALGIVPSTPGNKEERDEQRS